MKKVYLVIAVYILVVGCSSGGSSDGTPECGPNASCAAPRQTPDASIVGLWDRGGFQETQQEILYTFISADGDYLVYDFEQDDFGSGENCHTLDSGTIFRNSDSSNYTIEFVTSESDSESISTSFATIFLQGQNLEVRVENSATEVWLPVVGIATDDLELCQ